MPVIQTVGGAQQDLTNLQFIHFWISSIIAHATPPQQKEGHVSPRIFIIGTHRDSIPGNNQQRNRYVSDDKLRNVGNYDFFRSSFPHSALDCRFSIQLDSYIKN